MKRSIMDRVKELKEIGHTPRSITRKLRSEGYTGASGKPLTDKGVRWYLTKIEWEQQVKEQDMRRGQLRTADAQPEDRDPGQGAINAPVESVWDAVKGIVRVLDQCTGVDDRGRVEVLRDFLAKF